MHRSVPAARRRPVLRAATDPAVPAAARARLPRGGVSSRARGRAGLGPARAGAHPAGGLCDGVRRRARERGRGGAARRLRRGHRHVPDEPAGQPRRARGVRHRRPARAQRVGLRQLLVPAKPGAAAGARPALGHPAAARGLLCPAPHRAGGGALLPPGRRPRHAGRRRAGAVQLRRLQLLRVAVRPDLPFFMGALARRVFNTVQAASLF
mmetsp:Transcript_3570/g.11138  ORF Transcript_3570/g.11138 Transcript_3570/m.11138 type:complete len:209 (-) Transcript_3570:212-838(-)